MHLLKYQYQTERRSQSWKLTIAEHRKSIKRLLKGSPSLKYNVQAVIDEAFNDARDLFEIETGISKKTLPETYPYSFDQIMDDEFWPEEV
ncbi:protein containing DUF29 [Candidatus Omnitrophus magneticus]|uniref:Protein containing DUF29 n=1 Tax=Candidatus Omnitrophus magneticus TaxID=1609969 RepID=A0A0F0CTJ6_9BACT|nr:protein containing DUF29 [Candidatus Omnitrophus magneticus]